MIDGSEFLHGLALLLNWHIPIFMFMGVLFGVVLGAIPGFNAALGIAIMLPFTYVMSPLYSLVFLISIYTGGVWGGAITAILLNTPGAPAAVCTTLDGYPMTLQGKPGVALGISVTSSALGGFIGSLVLLFIMAPLASVALKFGDPEMFFLAIFGLTIIASLKGENIIKGFIAGLFGVLLGSIGMTHTGVMRATFGSINLLDGIPIVPALIGFLAFSELFSLIEQKQILDRKKLAQGNFKQVIAGIREAIRHPITIIRSSIIGVVIGAVPAAGATIGSIVSYNIAKQTSKDPDVYGTGHPDGIVAAETANNASQGGALATMLALGIPGGSSTAMLLGALMLQGWIPGPRLFIEHTDIIYATISSVLLQQIVLIIVGAVFCYFAARVVFLPTNVLVPVTIVLATIGAFSTRNLIFDAQLMFIFGILGYIMKKYKFPPVATVLGIILGPIADSALIRIVQGYSDNYWAILARPLTVLLIVASIVSFALPYILNKRRERAAA